MSRTLALAWTIVLASASTSLAQVTQRVSLSSTGAEGNQQSERGSVSADGRYVAFESKASTMYPGAPLNRSLVYVRDRSSGTTELMSQSPGGAVADTHCTSPRISADGRFVVFLSVASNLVPGDTNLDEDVFVRDRQLAVTERVSVDSNELESGGSCLRASISGDGRWVAFDSVTSNLVPGDTNDDWDVFLRDRQLGTTVRVSLGPAGEEGNGDSEAPWVSDDGRFVVFFSYATNLVAGDTNGVLDVFVRDVQLGMTERVSVDSSGVQGNLPSGFNGAKISADGRFVAFQSESTNLVPGDTNGEWDIFLRDLQAGTTERVSLTSSGGEANSRSYHPSLSADGRYVAFASPATNLDPADTDGYYDIFLRDRLNGTTEHVSVGPGGVSPEFWCYHPWISADGRFITFGSESSLLAHDDWNGREDVFLRDLLGGTNSTSLCVPGQGGVIACPCSNPSSGSGQGCNNSSGTGGALLSASEGAYLSSDSLVFTTLGERPTPLSIVLQGNALISSGAIYGQGVRCVGGALKRLYAKAASGGSISAPDFGAGDPSVSARSAALGNAIFAGQSRWYQVFYRDPFVLGGCPATSTFNVTQSLRVDWLP